MMSKYGKKGVLALATGSMVLGSLGFIGAESVDASDCTYYAAATYDDGTMQRDRRGLRAPTGDSYGRDWEGGYYRQEADYAPQPGAPARGNEDDDVHMYRRGDGVYFAPGRNDDGTLERDDGWRYRRVADDSRGDDLNYPGCPGPRRAPGYERAPGPDNLRASPVGYYYGYRDGYGPYGYGPYCNDGYCYGDGYSNYPGGYYYGYPDGYRYYDGYYYDGYPYYRDGYRGRRGYGYRDGYSRFYRDGRFGRDGGRRFRRVADDIRGDDLNYPGCPAPYGAPGYERPPGQDGAMAPDHPNLRAIDVGYYYGGYGPYGYGSYCDGYGCYNNGYYSDGYYYGYPDGYRYYDGYPRYRGRDGYRGRRYYRYVDYTGGDDGVDYRDALRRYRDRGYDRDDDRCPGPGGY